MWLERPTHFPKTRVCEVCGDRESVADDGLTDCEKDCMDDSAEIQNSVSKSKHNDKQP